MRPALTPRRTAALAAGAALLITLASFTSPWQRWERAGFDLFTLAFAPGTSAAPVTLVTIDEPSFAELGLRWPWPRSLHARLIEELAAAGAAVIAFDVVFAEPSDPADDAALAAAIRRAGNVVLAADTALKETAQGRLTMRIEPLALFRAAGATSGQVGIPLDPEQVARRLPAAEDALFRTILARYREAGGRSAAAAREVDRRRALLPYVGPEGSFPTVSYYQALSPATLLPPGSLAGRIVLVGLDLGTSTDPDDPGTDRFATPFSRGTGRRMAGVELHAQALAAALDGRRLERASAPLSLLVLALALTLGALAFARWPTLRGALALVGLALSLLAAAAVAFSAFGTWLPVLSPLAALVVLYLGQAAAVYSVTARERRFLKRAFSLYVSPQVVEGILSHPEQLVLGGSRRELTVLFTDLAGFTAMAEALEPEVVVGHLNRHLTAMTSIVLAHGGTIDKFIGDAVMAFWNAPLADPDHAQHAVAAARAMQAAMGRQARGPGIPELAMRIGIHTGWAVVGNLGSAERFDYTAVGDTVNLAARLEGANKLYGTGILLSEATAARLDSRQPLRPVDRVRVKGKARAVEIFTVEEDAWLRKCTAEAIATYRARRFAESRVCWTEIARRHAQDGLPPLYLSRLDNLEREPPPEDWDGSWGLPKM